MSKNDRDWEEDFNQLKEISESVIHCYDLIYNQTNTLLITDNKIDDYAEEKVRDIFNRNLNYLEKEINKIEAKYKDDDDGS